MLHVDTKFFLGGGMSGRWVLVPVLWGNLLALSSGSKLIICP
jgi:hypothetical protein